MITSSLTKLFKYTPCWHVQQSAFVKGQIKKLAGLFQFGIASFQEERERLVSINWNFVFPLPQNLMEH